jgi:predicted RNA-binding protein with PIN domain
MALLIDGYNLLHVTDIFGEAGGAETALHASRQALLDFLSASLVAKTRAETTIVFDAAGAPPGLPQTLMHEGITVHFARRYADADEMIEEIIDAHPAPRSLVVVSSDHRVQRAARRRGADYFDSDQWFADLRAARRAANAAGDERPGKPTGALTPEHVNYWLEKFSDPPPREK